MSESDTTDDESHESEITGNAPDKMAIALAAGQAAKTLVDIQLTVQDLHDDCPDDDVVAYEIEQKLDRVESSVDRVREIIEARPTNFPDDEIDA